MMRGSIWRAVAMGLGIVLLIAGGRIIAGFLPTRVYGCDFSMAYLAGRLAQMGRDVYSVKSLNDINAELGLPYFDKMGRATNPPPLLWLYRWLAMLKPAAAFWVWTAIEVLSLAVVLVACWRLVGRRLSRDEWVLATGLTVCSMPVFTNFWFGQVQLPVAALIMIGLWFSRRAVACVPLTLAAALKLFPWPLVMQPSLGQTGPSRYRRWALSVALLLVLATVPGWQMWESFFRHSTPILSEMAAGIYFNFSITSLLSAIAGGQVGRVLGTIVSLGLIVAAWVLSDRALRRGVAGAEESSACLLLVATVMCSLVAWTHYLVLLTYPLICLGAHVKEARRTWAGVLLLASLVAVNVAGSNPLAGFPQPLKLLGANLPLLVMVALYVYFAGRLRGK